MQFITKPITSTRQWVIIAIHDIGTDFELIRDFIDEWDFETGEVYRFDNIPITDIYGTEDNICSAVIWIYDQKLADWFMNDSFHMIAHSAVSLPGGSDDFEISAMFDGTDEGFMLLKLSDDTNQFSEENQYQVDDYSIGRRIDKEKILKDIEQLLG